MKILVPAILLLMTLAFWLALDKEDTGKLPSDIEVSFVPERNKVTGELLDVEIVRCKICRQVLSYVQFNLRGKVVSGHAYSHRCGKYTNDFVRYNGSGIGPPSFNLVDWLERWQRRLRVKR